MAAVGCRLFGLFLELHSDAGDLSIDSLSDERCPRMTLPRDDLKLSNGAIDLYGFLWRDFDRQASDGTWHAGIFSTLTLCRSMVTRFT